MIDRINQQVVRTTVFLAALSFVLFLGACEKKADNKPGGGQTSVAPASAKAQELNLLCWTGYEERALLDAFEKKHNINVNAKTFVGADAMVSLLSQSKGIYDVVVVDPEYIEKLHAAGRLAAMNPAEYDFAGYLDELKDFPLCYSEDKMYAILVEYGSCGLVYNTAHLTTEDVKSYDILWDTKVKGRVGIWDWYLPSMGVISCSLGYQDPYDITDAQFDAIGERLAALRPQVRAIHPSPPEMLSALANDETWIVPAGGEWVAAILKQQGKPIDWVVPDIGGIMWMDTLCIVNDAPHPEAAKAYVHWMMTPEAQALLSQKQAYQSNVPNMKAYDLMPPAHKDMLKVHDADEAKALIGRLHVRSLPINQSEKRWQDAWEKFKASR